jgi:penicillin amidase
MDSSGAALYAYFWQSLLEESLKVRIPRSLWNSETALDSNSRLMNTMYALLQDPQHPFWDNPTTLDIRETRDDILVRAFEKALANGIKAQGKDIDKWRWGAIHTAVFRNQTFGKSGIGPIEAIFNRGPVPVNGGFQQVNSTDWKPNEPFTVHSVSSMRQIMDLSNLASTLAMHTTGQSGHAGNRHYADMIDPWRKVLYHPSWWERASLEAWGAERLTIIPK